MNYFLLFLFYIIGCLITAFIAGLKDIDDTADMGLMTIFWPAVIVAVVGYSILIRPFKFVSSYGKILKKKYIKHMTTIPVGTVIISKSLFGKRVIQIYLAYEQDFYNKHLFMYIPEDYYNSISSYTDETLRNIIKLAININPAKKKYLKIF